MNKLFVKIFLWFWLAMALVAAALFLPTELVQAQRVSSEWRAFSRQRMVVFGRTAVHALHVGGQQGLRDYIQDAEEETSGIFPYVFDAELNELAGRRVPPEAQEVASLSLEGGEERPTARAAGELGGVFAGGTFLDRRGHRHVIVQWFPPRLNPPGALSLAGSWAAVVLISGLVCYGLASYLAAPVSKLGEATRRFAEGDLQTRVGPELGTRTDEIADLGRDFDDMAGRIESLLNKQQQLLSDISHELRSPLARLYVALGLARRRSGPEAREALDRIERETERLNELIGQLLTLTRLESGDPAARLAPVELSALVGQIASDANYEASGRDRGVRVIESERCESMAIVELLERAVENVVRNAVRYTPAGTSAEISLRKQNNGGGAAGEAIISVRDHGPGVPDEALSELFRPFYRTGDARDRGSGGTGLGLSISERSIRLHGGTIAAENASGGGLRVEMRLPLTLPTAGGERRNGAASTASAPHTSSIAEPVD